MPSQNKKVLIAEDQEAMAGVLVHKFNASGIQTTHVATGDLVVPNLQKEHYDLLLLDLMMPNMDGFDVLKQMQELNLDTPVIVLSNLGQNEDILKARAFGVKNYIIKSTVTPADILNYAKSYLEK